MSNGKETAIVYTLSFGIPALIEFHTYSSYLSSPWTTGKLMTPEDLESFNKLFTEAALSSLVFSGATGAIMSWGYGSPWPFVVAVATAIAVTVWMWYDYESAIAARLGSASDSAPEPEGDAT